MNDGEYEISFAFKADTNNAMVPQAFGDDIDVPFIWVFFDCGSEKNEKKNVLSPMEAAKLK